MTSLRVVVSANPAEAFAGVTAPRRVTVLSSTVTGPQGVPGTGGDMMKADNLSGLANYTTARSNLGLGSAAVLASTAFDAAGVAAALVDDLSGVSDAATARTNLGLGTAATTAATAYATAAQGATADGAVPKSLVDGKGELLVGSADNTVDNLAVGTDGHVLTLDSAQALGVKWAAASGGGGGGAVAGVPAALVLPGTSTFYASPRMWVTTSDTDAWRNLDAGYLLLAMFVVGQAGTINEGITDVQATVAYNFRFGLWRSTDGRPSTLLWDSGDIATTAGTKTTTVSPTVSVSAGEVLWTGYITSGTTSLLNTSASSLHAWNAGQYGQAATCLRSTVAYGALASSPTIDAFSQSPHIPSIRWKVTPT